jgi:hypothetical protein
MISIAVESTNINVEALDSDLREALGSTVLGISWDGQEVGVYLSEDATQAQISQARQIVEQHNPDHLTPDQQAALARNTLLETLRNENAAQIDVSAYEEESPTVQTLAQKIAWLELEVAAMRREKENSLSDAS